MDWQSAHTRLLVDDYRACFLFYRDVLGMKAGFGDEGSNYADFEIGGVTIALFDRHEMATALGLSIDPAGSSPDRVALILGVGDVDQAASQLRANGVRLLAEPADQPDWGIRTAHFRDPSGTLVEINAPL